MFPGDQKQPVNEADSIDSRESQSVIWTKDAALNTRSLLNLQAQHLSGGSTKLPGGQRSVKHHHKLRKNFGTLHQIMEDPLKKLSGPSRNFKGPGQGQRSSGRDGDASF